MYLLINSLLVLLNGSLQFFALSFFLTPKKSRLQNMMPYCLLLYLTVILKCAATTSLASSVFGLCNTATLFCYAIFAFKNPFWEKIGKCVLMLGVLSITTEAIYSLILKYVLHLTISMNYYSEDMVFPLLLLDLFTLVYSTLLVLLTKIIKRFKCTKEFKRRQRFLLIALFAFIQLLTPATLFMLYASDISEKKLHFSLLAPFVLIITNIFLLLYAMNQEEKIAANTAYLELQTLHKMEEEHYRELEQHSEALAKIRHDFQNQLATVHMLLQNKNYTDAKEMALRMKELLDSVTIS